MSQYTRVIPRDLFNESKLLKCLGQLSLLIENGVGIRWPLRLEHCTSGLHGENVGFVIEQNPADGGLYCSNVKLFCGDKEVGLHTWLNARDAYPLLFDCGDDTEAEVFNSNGDGQLSDEFKTYLDSITPKKKHERRKR